MNMKNKYNKALIISFLSLFGFGILFVGTASARGMFGGWGMGMMNFSADDFVARHQTMFQNEATLLGISVEEVKGAWAQGKNFWELAKEKGITEEQLQQKIRDNQLQQLKTQLKALVDKGVITQAQADQRLQVIQNQQQSKIGKGGRGLGMGIGMGRHMGFGF